MGGTDLFFSLIGVVFVIFLAYWGTRWISSKYKNLSNGKYIKVLERTVIAQDKNLVLIKMNEKIYLLGLTGQAIETICTMDACDLQEPQAAEKTQDFGSVLFEMVKKQAPIYKKRVSLIKNKAKIQATTFTMQAKKQASTFKIQAKKQASTFKEQVPFLKNIMDKGSKESNKR